MFYREHLFIDEKSIGMNSLIYDGDQIVSEETT
jgi:hypothetical protein